MATKKTPPPGPSTKFETELVVNTLREMAAELESSGPRGQGLVQKHRWSVLHTAANRLEEMKVRDDALDQMHEAMVTLGLIHIPEEEL